MRICLLDGGVYAGREAMMPIKSNHKGLTLVELLVAISLLSIVLTSAYMFLAFSYHSVADTQASFDIGSEARVSMMKMEKNIRNAQAVTIDGKRHLAVEVPVSGNALNVYTDVDSDGVMEMVTYKVDNGAFVMGEAELGAQPAEWFPVVKRVVQPAGSTDSIFKIEATCVHIKLFVEDESEHFKDKPVCVEASFTVRSKEAMSL
jgi:prepilin-type N-terminal cleavage/methylation domain-containing protein